MNISIALCTYNGAKFLPEQLDSIGRQTRQPDEIIVCDDRSADHTLDILQSFKKVSPFPVQILLNEKTLGPIKNFEKAVQLCNGDIIALSDQDDIWEHHKLEKVESVFRNEPEAGYVFSDGDAVDEDLNSLGYSLWDAAGFQGPLFEMYTSGNQLCCFLRRQFVTGATMALRSCFRELPAPYPADTVWMHDNWISAVLSSCGALGVAITDKLIRYRHHREQQIGVSRPQVRTSYIDEYTSFSRRKEFLWEQWLRWGESCLYLKQRIEAMNNSYIDTSESIRLLEQFKRHFSSRKLIHTKKGYSRLKPVLSEMISGRYGLFSNSWKSAVRDLLLH